MAESPGDAFVAMAAEDVADELWPLFDDLGEAELDRLEAMTAAEQVRHFYLHGECLPFARTLHALTGWPLVSVCHPDHGFLHALVCEPGEGLPGSAGGRLLDASGWTTLEAVGRHYGLRPHETARLLLGEGDPWDSGARPFWPEDGDERSQARLALSAIRFLPGAPFGEPGFLARFPSPPLPGDHEECWAFRP